MSVSLLNKKFREFQNKILTILKNNSLGEFENRFKLIDIQIPSNNVLVIILQDINIRFLIDKSIISEILINPLIYDNFQSPDLVYSYLTVIEVSKIEIINEFSFFVKYLNQHEPDWITICFTGFVSSNYGDYQVISL